MLREIYIKNHDDKMIRYSLQLLWSNQLLKNNKITKNEYEKIVRKLKREYIENIALCD